MKTALKIAAVLALTWFFFPELEAAAKWTGQRLANRVAAIPSLPKPQPPAKPVDRTKGWDKPAWDATTAPVGPAHPDKKPVSSKSSSKKTARKSTGCNRTLPTNPGHCDALQYYSGNLAMGGRGNGLVYKGLLTD